MEAGAAARRDERLVERDPESAWERRRSADHDEWDAWRRSGNAKRGGRLGDLREEDGAPQLRITIHRLRGRDSIADLFLDHMDFMSGQWRFTGAREKGNGDITLLARPRLDVRCQCRAVRLVP